MKDTDIPRSTLVEKAKNTAISAHNNTNHLYDGKPYEAHLQAVYEIACKHIQLVDPAERDTVLAACWMHDTIEDCRMTYNDVALLTNKGVAEIVYALTNEKGKNRKQRANAKYYRGIRSTPNAAFVKFCDRIANIKYSAGSKSSMYDKYRAETIAFINSLRGSAGSFNFELEKELWELTYGKVPVERLSFEGTEYSDLRALAIAYVLGEDLREGKIYEKLSNRGFDASCVAACLAYRDVDEFYGFDCVSLFAEYLIHKAKYKIV